jgi:hypothetical protein
VYLSQTNKHKSFFQQGKAKHRTDYKQALQAKNNQYTNAASLPHAFPKPYLKKPPQTPSAYNRIW